VIASTIKSYKQSLQLQQRTSLGVAEYSFFNYNPTGGFDRRPISCNLGGRDGQSWLLNVHTCSAICKPNKDFTIYFTKITSFRHIMRCRCSRHKTKSHIWALRVPNILHTHVGIQSATCNKKYLQIRDRYYHHNSLRFSTIFGEKFSVYLKNQLYGKQFS
jgi:hypothetical protein